MFDDVDNYPEIEKPKSQLKNSQDLYIPEAGNIFDEK